LVLVEILHIFGGRTALGERGLAGRCEDVNHDWDFLLVNEIIDDV